MTRRLDVFRMTLGTLLVLLAGLLLTGSGLLMTSGGLATAVAVAGTVAVAAALLTCALIASCAAGPLPPTRIRTAIRDRERRTAFLAQRDPDASGRPRPRAPGRLVPTAA
ncbi:DUF6412 domain-containing protein [Streptomyces sp. URMC 123]|uniref:DUF6412 domain-containing protein n=1 Tax=Streptomyces sp. URMC 123 TaxID=3423403 RepID=UPI003F1A6904